LWVRFCASRKLSAAKYARSRRSSAAVFYRDFWGPAWPNEAAHSRRVEILPAPRRRNAGSAGAPNGSGLTPRLGHGYQPLARRSVASSLRNRSPVRRTFVGKVVTGAQRLPGGPAVAGRQDRPAEADRPPVRTSAKCTLRRVSLFADLAHFTKNGRFVAGSGHGRPTNCDGTAIKNVRSPRDKPSISIASDGVARGRASTNAVVEFTKSSDESARDGSPGSKSSLPAPLC
jgi:hypothetical protein